MSTVFRRGLCLALCLLLLLCCSCQQRPIQAEGFALDTFLSLTLYKGGDLQLANDALSIADGFGRQFSAHDEHSPLYALNQSGQGKLLGAPYHIENMLVDAAQVTEASGGAFRVTLGALTQLWDFSAQNPSLPAQDDIALALTQVNPALFVIQGEDATLLGGARLDFGAIAKGYVGDLMKARLQAGGVSCALLDLGGNVITIGQKPDGSNWRVGIQSPFDGGIFGSIELGEGFVSTSSGNQRGFELDGRRYHHILDPATGYPAQSDIASVTIVSTQSGAQADALSTACFVLGLDASLALLQNFDETTQAVFILHDGQVETTPHIQFTKTP